MLEKDGIQMKTVHERDVMGIIQTSHGSCLNLVMKKWLDRSWKSLMDGMSVNPLRRNLDVEEVLVDMLGDKDVLTITRDETFEPTTTTKRTK
jgi:hypothetical protein